MAYECQSCYSRIEDGDIGENSLGDPQCPECGSFDVVKIEEGDEIMEERSLFFGEDEEDINIDLDDYRIDYSGD